MFQLSLQILSEEKNWNQTQLTALKQWWKKTWGHGAHDWARSSGQKQKMKRDSLSLW